MPVSPYHIRLFSNSVQFLPYIDVIIGKILVFAPKTPYVSLFSVATLLFTA